MSTTAHTMSCMEVWGGNHAVEQAVAMPGLELHVVSSPFQGNDQGGDVHYVSSCGTGRISRLVLADVSGHGAQVGDLARSLRLLMRRFVNYLDQTRFVDALNRGLVADAEGRFATSLAMTYFAPTRRLDLVNAGHPRPFLYRAAEKQWSILASPERGSPPAPAGVVSNLPLGVLERTRYDQFGLRLDAGDVVLAYTDALVEARDPEGRLLGEEGLLDLVRALDASCTQTFAASLLARVEAFRGGATADDDVTVLVMRQANADIQAPLAARLSATLRFLGLLAGRLVPMGPREPLPWPELNRANLLGPFSRRAEAGWSAPGAAAGKR